MGSLYRSEEMSLCQLFLQTDSAFASVAELGELGLCQFRDLNPEVSSYMRKYVLEVKRCDEMERKIRFVEQELETHKIVTPEPLGPISIPLPRNMNDLEAKFNKLEDELRLINNSTESLRNNYMQLMDMKHVLLKIRVLFDEGQKTQALHQIAEMQQGYAGPLSPRGAITTNGFTQLHLTQSINSDLDTRVLEKSGNPIELQFMAGIIQRERVQAFERVLWRMCHGKVYLRTIDVDEEEHAPFLLYCYSPTASKMGSRLHSWINQPVQNLQMGSSGRGGSLFQENVNNSSQYVFLPSSMTTLGNFSSPPPSLLTKLMPQPALSRFYASSLSVDKSPCAALSSDPIKTLSLPNQQKLISLVSLSSELSNEQVVWNIVLSRVQAAVAINQAAPELLEELKRIKELGHSGLCSYLKPVDNSISPPHLQVKHSDLGVGLNGYTFSENENNNNDHSGIRVSSTQDVQKKGKTVLPLLQIDGQGQSKSAQMHGREFPIQVLKLKRLQSFKQQKCVKCESTVDSAKSQTSVIKSPRLKFCIPLVDASSSSLCDLNKDVAADLDITFGEKVIKPIDDFDELSVSSIESSVKSSSLTSVIATGTAELAKANCSFHFEDCENYYSENKMCSGFANSANEEAFNMVCSQFQSIFGGFCGLCYATGLKSHRVENCPLLKMPSFECSF